MKIRILIVTWLGLASGHFWAARRAVLIFAAVALGAQTLAAQANAVRLGQHEAHQTRILAKFKDSARVEASAESLRQIGSRVHHRYNLARGLTILEDNPAGGVAGVGANDEARRRNRLLNRINQLKQSGLFDYVEPDYIVRGYLTPTDRAFTNGTLWGLRNLGQNGGIAGADIGATSAWDLTTGSTNVIVAVIDTGIRYTHRDLRTQMWRNPGEVAANGIDDDGNGYVDDVYGVNAITGSGNPFDDNDHGTHVAGTIGAAANEPNASVGVTWRVRLMGCKFLGAQGFGNTSDAIECIDYAVSKGARILNNSWGGGGYSQALFDSINAARIQGVLFVAAAGNSANNNDASPAYPAGYQLDNVISVAAIDRRDNLASFSSYGLTTVHLGAPGVAIYSSTAGSDTNYDSFQGTSMATPHVSGVAALILSRFPGADLEEVKERILRGTVPIPALNGITTTGGRLNAYNSLILTGNGILNANVDPPSGSTLLSSSAQPIFVKVTDVFGVQNATVSAVIAGITNLTFSNNGQPPDKLANDSTYSALFQIPAATNPVTMTVTVTAPGKFGVTNVVYYNIVAAPLNNNFSNATKVPIGGAVYLSNNRFASIEAKEPPHAGVTTRAGSLWWTLSPTTTTNAFIDTTGSSVDTVVAVYTGNALTNLQLVAATNDVGLRKQAYLGFNAQAGQAYRIVVASVNTNSLGSITLRIAPGGQPDTTPPQVFVTSPLSGLTVSNQVLNLAGTALDPAPDATGVREVLVSVNGAIANSAVGTTNWSATALLRSGLNGIVVRSVDAAGHNSSPVTIQINYFVPDPANDVFANAIPLVGSSGNSSVSTTNATKESSEPAHAGNAGGKSVWWSFQPALDGVLTLSTTNSTFDTLLGLYTGPDVSHLSPIASNDDAYEAAPGGFSQIIQAVRASQLYRIAVDGYDNVSGTVFLDHSFVPATVYRLTTSNSVGGSVLPASGDFASDSTVVLTAVSHANYEFDAWSGSVASLSNPLSIVITNDLSITGNFRPIIFTDGFESGNLLQLAWTTAGNKPWIVQTNVVSAGGFAARSGAIAHSQTSSLILTTNIEAGNIAFDYRVSSELKWDFLHFLVDGVLQQQWSGEVGWATFVFPVVAGPHTLEWRYTKDASLSAGLDAAFLDNVRLPVGVGSAATTPAYLQLLRQPDGSLLLQIQGQANQPYVIQGTTSLIPPIVWQNLSTNTAASGVIQFVDPGAVTNPLRFYRALAP